MISVVIPLYNKKNCISSTIDSVLSQNYQDFEILVVDDGSSDGSADVVRLHTDPRIRLITKGNGGVSSARNEGIRSTNSEYIAFLDADDLWESEFLTEIQKMICDFPEAGILGTGYSYLQNSKKIIAEKPVPKDYYGIIDNSAWDLGHLYCSSAVCCKKSALEDIGMFDERVSYGEDLDVWWRIMLKYPAAYSNKSLATYRFDEENRAMMKIKPVEKMHIFYFEKYAAERVRNDSFRHFIDKECMWWLYPYTLDKDTDKKEIKRILGEIDLSEYKTSFRFRFMFPRLYKILHG